MQHLEGSGTPVLYTGRTVLKGQLPWCDCLAVESVALKVRYSTICGVYMPPVLAVICSRSDRMKRVILTLFGRRLCLRGL